METFVRVVETGSFSSAAGHMNVTQSAVSKSVSQLEQRLGVRLLMRSTRGLSPTEAGQTYLERARRAIVEAEEAERAARGVDAGLSGRLRVAVGEPIGKHQLMPHLPSFLAAHPDLSIDLLFEDRSVDLVGEGLDLALRAGPLHDSALVGRRIAATAQIVLGAPEYFHRAGVPRCPGDLARHEAVICAVDRCAGNRWVFRKNGEEAPARLAGRLQVNTCEALRAAVLNGVGIAVGTRWMFGPELASGSVNPVLTDWALPEADLWVVFSAGRLANAKTRAFVRFVESVLSGSCRAETEAAAVA